MMKLFGAIIALLGVIFIYDARKITKQAFSFGDQNEGTMGMKITGFVFAMVGACMLL